MRATKEARRDTARKGADTRRHTDNCGRTGHVAIVPNCKMDCPCWCHCAAARPRLALVQRADGQYYKDGWGHLAFWTASAGARERLAARGITAEVVSL